MIKAKTLKLALIGGGNMAEALLQGVIKAEIVFAKDVIVTDIRAERLAYLEKKYQIKTSMNNVLAVEAADVIILAVKPQNAVAVLNEIQAVVSAKKLLISIMAGVPISELKRKTDCKVVRSMPNTPALIGAGMTALAADTGVEKSDKDFAEKIFKAVGEIVWVEEVELNAVTALSGSGPAFVYRLIGYFFEAGQKLGLSVEKVKKLTLNTFLGATKMVMETDETPEALVQKVASPGGTTVAGLNVLDNSDVKQVLNTTISAANKRAAELTGGK
jgi:pyrroline-5-carboxylate reductase